MLRVAKLGLAAALLLAVWAALLQNAEGSTRAELLLVRMGRVLVQAAGG